MRIFEVSDNKRDYMDLLFLADEQEDMIDKYLDGGKMYVLEDDGVKGECVVTDTSLQFVHIFVFVFWYNSLGESISGLLRILRRDFNLRGKVIDVFQETRAENI